MSVVPTFRIEERIRWDRPCAEDYQNPKRSKVVASTPCKELLRATHSDSQIVWPPQSRLSLTSFSLFNKNVGRVFSGDNPGRFESELGEIDSRK